MEKEKEAKRIFECDICLKSIGTRSNLLRHKRNIHNEESHVKVLAPEETVPCRVCGKLLSKKGSRAKHEKVIHNYVAAVKRQKCPICDKLYLKEMEVLNHLERDHLINLEIEDLSFECYEDFNLWKEALEKDTESYFIKRVIYKTQQKEVERYICHRSGNHVSRSKGLRQQRRLGTNKMQSLCPASIRVRKIQSDGAECVSVKFLSTHVGHESEVKRLPLSKNEQHGIAGQLLSGMSSSIILNNISENNPRNKRLKLTTTQDLRNIARKYSLKSPATVRPNDIIFVESWIDELEMNESSPILLYKSAGKYKETLSQLKNEDFVLGFMNDVQEEIFKMYGGQVVCVDRIYGTDTHDVQLTTIIVFNDTWECLPVAFLWSNHQTKDVFRYFFEAVKTRIGNLHVKIFMSDDHASWCNAFLTVFGPSDRNLLCDWQVKKAWNKALCGGTSEVVNLEKRDQILNDLCDLANKSDEAVFKTQKSKTKTALLEDKETAAFGKHFVSKYLSRCKRWAACYRSGLKINMDITTEEWYRSLTDSSNLNGKFGGRLDKVICNLMKSLRLKLISELGSDRRQIIIRKLSVIARNHKVAYEMAKEVTILRQNHNLFSVSSSSQIGQSYEVKILECDVTHSCNLQCNGCYNICLHQAQCSCLDSVVKYNFCTHAHVVVISRTSNLYIELLSEEENYFLLSEMDTSAVVDESTETEVSQNIRQSSS